MGSSPYWYTVPYEADVNAALQKLRVREFKAGRYNPVIPKLRFPLTDKSPAPGAKHKSIAAALTAADADGIMIDPSISKKFRQHRNSAALLRSRKRRLSAFLDMPNPHARKSWI